MEVSLFQTSHAEVMPASMEHACENISDNKTRREMGRLKHRLQKLQLFFVETFEDFFVDNQFGLFF